PTNAGSSRRRSANSTSRESPQAPLPRSETRERTFLDGGAGPGLCALAVLGRARAGEGGPRARAARRGLRCDQLQPRPADLLLLAVLLERGEGGRARARARGRG